MKKKALCLLFSLVMVLWLLPTSVMAVGTSDYGNFFATVTGSTLTDTTASRNQAYKVNSGTETLTTTPKISCKRTESCGETYDHYNYIINGLGDLFPNGMVLPVNDDVYIVMWGMDRS